MIRNASNGATSDIQTPKRQILKEYDRLIKNLVYIGVQFPITYQDYKTFEGQNQIRINVFAYKGEAYAIHASREKYDDTTSLFLITREAGSHYVLIRDFNRFM